MPRAKEIFPRAVGSPAPYQSLYHYRQEYAHGPCTQHCTPFKNHCINTHNKHLEQWVGAAETITWPTRSPNLNPLDFYLWNIIKSVVYGFGS